MVAPLFPPKQHGRGRPFPLFLLVLLFSFAFAGFIFVFFRYPFLSLLCLKLPFLSLFNFLQILSFQIFFVCFRVSGVPIIM